MRRKTCALAHSRTASNLANSHRARCRAAHIRHLRPGRESPSHQCPIVARPHRMAARSKMVRHLCMHREEALGLPHRFESSHGAFSRTGGLVRVLSPVVQQPPTMMRDTGYQIFLCCRVAGKLIGHDGTRQISMSLESLAKEALRGFGIPALLHQDVEHLSALIDRAPQVHQLFEMPRISGSTALAPKPACIIGAKSQTSQPDRLVGDFYASLQHHLLDIAKAQAEPKIQPHIVSNNLARKAVTTVTRGG